MRYFGLLAILPLALSPLQAKPSEWQDLRQQIKTTLHIPADLPALRDKSYGSFRPSLDVTADRVSYYTAYDLEVPAIVYHQAAASISKHPALVIVNGHMGDKSSFYAYWAGMLYARAGAVVLTYDPIGEYERNKERRSGTNQHDDLIPPEEMGRRMGGLMVTDVLQAVHYLRSRKDVDDKRIAVLGYSMGSFISALACAVSTDVRACVLVGGGDLDGPGGYWDSSPKKMCQAIPYQSLAFLGDRAAALYALNAKRGSTLIWNGSDDTVVDIPGHGQQFFEKLRAATIARAGSSKDVFEFGFTPGGGHRPYFLAQPVAAWLNQKLRFPEWPKKEVDAIPAMRVSEWRAKNHLPPPTDPESEKNEGGLLALGNDIPAISRDDLHTVPDARWAAEQLLFIYETWLDRAQAAVRGNAP